MKHPNPDCERHCKFVYGYSMTTDVYYNPVYDRHGNNLNPDGNVTSGTIDCIECHKRWSYSTQYGKTKFHEVIG